MSWTAFFVIFSAIMTGSFLLVAYNARVLRAERDSAQEDLRITETIAREIEGDLREAKLSLRNSYTMLELILDSDEGSSGTQHTGKARLDGRGSINVVNRRAEGGQAAALRSYSARSARNAGRALRSRSSQVRRPSMA